MITLKHTTKLARELMLEYERSRAVFLDDCYSRYSTNKARAYRECRNKMLDELGHSFKILSYNTFCFTCGWINQYGDLRIETPCKSYIIEDYLPF